VQILLEENTAFKKWRLNRKLAKSQYNEYTKYNTLYIYATLVLMCLNTAKYRKCTFRAGKVLSKKFNRYINNTGGFTNP
jgi:hypothetical protein